MLTGGRGDATVEGHGDLHEDERAFVLAPAGEAFVEAAGFLLADAKTRPKPCCMQCFHAVTSDGGVGIDGGGDDAAKAGGDEGLSARRGAAGVVAGLKGDVRGATFEAFTCVLRGFAEGNDFSVVDEVVLMPAFSDDLAGAVKDDAADGGVG